MNATHPTGIDASLFPASSDEALAQARALNDKAPDGAESMASEALEDVTRITNLAKDWLQRYASSAMSAAAAVKEESDIVRDQTREFVRERPMQALLIAAGVGALIGGIAVLASRRDA